jgi:hypothetical protein
MRTLALITTDRDTLAHVPFMECDVIHCDTMGEAQRVLSDRFEPVVLGYGPDVVQRTFDDAAEGLPVHRLAGAPAVVVADRLPFELWAAVPLLRCSHMIVLPDGLDVLHGVLADAGVGR